MKRAFVFLVAAPVSVFIVACVLLGAAAGVKSNGLFLIPAAWLALITVSVAVLAGALDAFLARALAVPLRAPLVAAAGAIAVSGLTFGLVYLVFNQLPEQELLAYVAIGGAACMGACSLLANDYGWRQSVVHAKSLLRN